jgi:hypothetical protein
MRRHVAPMQPAAEHSPQPKRPRANIHPLAQREQHSNPDGVAWRMHVKPRREIFDATFEEVRKDEMKCE